MGDGGLSVGAAFAMGKIHKPLSNVYLGRSFSDKNIIKALNKKEFRMEKTKKFRKRSSFTFKIREGCCSF